jgi:putative transposase
MAAFAFIGGSTGLQAREKHPEIGASAPAFRYHFDMHRAPQHLRTYFITTTTANRRSIFQVEANAQLLLDVLMEQRVKNRFLLHAFVLMPDHMHAILTPAADVSLERAVQFIKGNFSHRLKSKFPVWTPSFNETQIRDLESFESFRRYILQNPVRAKLVVIAEGFPYSSASEKHFIDPIPEHLDTAFAGAESPSSASPIQ